MKQIQPSFITLGSGAQRCLLELWPHKGGDCLLFYPGTMACPEQYGHLLQRLWQRGVTIAALHFTGHGRAPHTARFTLSDLLDNCLAAEARLHVEGYDTIVCCGHSQGAILALYHAAYGDGLAAAIPIAGAYPQLEEAITLTRFGRWAAYRTSLLALIEKLATRLPYFPVPISAYLPIKRILKGGRGFQKNARFLRSTYPLAFLYSLFSADIPPHAQCPVHMVSALNDALFTPALIQKSFDLLHSPKKTLFWLPKGGHMAVFVPRIAEIAARHIAACCAGAGLRLAPET